MNNTKAPQPPILGGIKGIIFDYGGTLDTCGQHWGKKLWHAYERQHVPVSEQQFRDAYVYGERTLGRNPIIKPDYTFHRTLATKIRLEMEHLCTHGAWDASEEEFKQKHQAVLEDVYAEVVATTAHSAEVLTQLSERFPMVLVSNFYGNIECVLQEFGLRKFFPSIVESAVVGIRKPDPRIFEIAMNQMHAAATETGYVGDTISRDVLGSRNAGLGLCVRIDNPAIAHRDAAFQGPDAPRADYVIHELPELVPILSGINGPRA
jgi:putative hydrolase of the HAD superfamily